MIIMNLNGNINGYDYLKNEEIKPYNKVTIISNNVRIF